MSTRIIEYGGKTREDDLQIVPKGGIGQAALTATGTSAQSTAFAAGTDLVCVQSDEAVCVAFGANPTATANDYKIPAGGEQFFDVDPNWKVAVITA